MDIAQIAKELLAAYDGGTTVPSLVSRYPVFDWDEGYQVLAEILRLRRARGEKTVGRKIGFTNRIIGDEFGAPAPIWAHCSDRTLISALDDRATVSLRGSVQPRLEPEIAFKLKSALPAGIEEPRKVLDAVEWLAPSFEIVDCHFAGWKFKSAESAADFALHWRLIVGTPRIVRDADKETLVNELRDCQLTLRKNGAVADRGVGANALGHPATALAHLAAVLARQSQFEPLAAGEIITTCPLTAAMPIEPGATWTSEYTGLPIKGLQLSFTA